MPFDKIKNPDHEGAKNTVYKKQRTPISITFLCVLCVFLAPLREKKRNVFVFIRSAKKIVWPGHVKTGNHKIALMAPAC
jgi:hypothetical protein